MALFYKSDNKIKQVTKRTNKKLSGVFFDDQFQDYVVEVNGEYYGDFNNKYAAINQYNYVVSAQNEDPSLLLFNLQPDQKMSIRETLNSKIYIDKKSLCTLIASNYNVDARVRKFIRERCGLTTYNYGM